MHPLTLSGLVTAGILRKRDRILYFSEGDAEGCGWLRRRRFKVEEITAQSLSASLPVLRRSLCEVVVVEMTIGTFAELQACSTRVREALQYVRPGGSLLVSFRYSRPFDDTMEENASRHLSSTFPELKVVSQDLPVTAGPDSGTLYRIVKGGAYIPRLPVKYIESPEPFEEACNRLAEAKCIGLDVETTLKDPRILCTVQLATEAAIYLIDTLLLKDLLPLKRLMENPQVIKVIHNHKFETAVLKQYGIEIHNVYDTLTESRKRYKQHKDGQGHRLSDVCERELGLYLDKSLQTSDWTKRPLTLEQRNYAAADAEVLVRLYHVFSPPEPPMTGELF